MNRGNTNASTKDARRNTKAFVRSKTNTARAQNKAYVQSTGLPPPLKQIMSQLLMPVTASGLRLSPFSDQARTGTATVHHDFTVTQGSGYVGTYGDAGEQLFYLFRQPLRQAVVLVNTGSATFDYEAVFSNAATTLYIAANETAPLPIAYLSCSTTGAPHGPYAAGTSNLYTGSVRSAPEYSWIWMDKSDTLTLTTSAGAPSLVAYQLLDFPSTDPSIDQYSTTVVTGTTAVFTAPIAGYYAFASVCDGTSRTISIKLHMLAGDKMAHYSVPQPLTHSSWFTNIRANAVSLLISNRTAKQWVNGTALGAHITDPIPFYKVAKATIGARSRYYEGLAEKGMYAYLPVWGQRALEFENAVKLSSGANSIAVGTVIDTQFPLDDDTGYCAFSLTSVLNNSAYALDFHCVLTTALEYKTDDQYTELEFPSISTTATLDILNLMARDFPITENPMHWSDVASFIGRIGRFAASHATKIGGALSTLFPGYAMPINFVANKLQSD